LTTKERILEAAIALFNEQGTAAVNTHHIAARCGISPGNLYYHYENKEEIIRAIFEKIDLYQVAAWPKKGISRQPANFAEFMEFFFGNLIRYRFFFQEFFNLLQTDPVLAKEWRKAYAKLFEVMRQTVDLWIKAGILQKLESAEEVDAFIHNSWIITNFSAPYLKAQHGIKNRGIQQGGTRLILWFLMPYHTPEGKVQLKHYANSLGS
jgi:AcrR family transcriptional regulator